MKKTLHSVALAVAMPGLAVAAAAPVVYTRRFEDAGAKNCSMTGLVDGHQGGTIGEAKYDGQHQQQVQGELDCSGISQQQADLGVIAAAADTDRQLQ